MRWLIALLLAANVVVALWLGVEQRREGRTAALPAPDIGSLQLLDERPGTLRDATREGQTDSLSDLPPASPLSSATMVRLADKGSDAQSGQPAREDTEKTAATRTTGPPRACWEIGPFQQADEARALVLPRGIRRLAIRRARVRVPAGYYVLVPPAVDREQALQTVERLREKGVRDSWLFPSGPLRNAISLGMFSKQENAMRRRRQIEDMGFSVQLKRRERTVEGHVVIARGLDIPANERLLDRVTKGLWRRVACPPLP